MKIKLLGLQISVGKPKIEQEINSDTSLIWEPQKAVNLKPRLHPITEAINWPDPGEDPWAKTIINNAISEFDRSAKSGHFSICALHTLVKECGIISSKEGGLALSRLRSVHCIDWSRMEQEVLDSIVPLANLILEGRTFKTVNSRTFEHGE